MAVRPYKSDSRPPYKWLLHQCPVFRIPLSSTPFVCSIETTERFIFFSSVLFLFGSLAGWLCVMFTNFVGCIFVFLLPRFCCSVFGYYFALLCALRTQQCHSRALQGRSVVYKIQKNNNKNCHTLLCILIVFGRSVGRTLGLLVGLDLFGCHQPRHTHSYNINFSANYVVNAGYLSCVLSRIIMSKIVHNC